MLFLSAMLSFGVAGFVWQFFYSPFPGGLNALLGAAGLESLQSAWLGQPISALSIVLPVVIIAIVRAQNSFLRARKDFSR